MSFTQVIDNYIIKFEKEEDYLNCRLQYVQYCKDAVTPEVTFEQYVISGMYPDGICVVESVEPVVIPVSTNVGNDSNYFSFDSGNFTIGTSSIVTSPGSPFYYDDADSSNIGTITNISVTSGALSSGEIASAIWDNAIPVSYGTTLSKDKKEKVEEKKEEPPDEPIKSRWEILDFRKDKDVNDG